MLDSTDPMSLIRYRIAFGEAARLIEMARFDHAWGRDFAARIEGEGEKILTEVISRIGDREVEVIKEAVEDALAGRRPQWKRMPLLTTLDRQTASTPLSLDRMVETPRD